MGYRSDVFLGIIIPDEKVDAFKTFIQMTGWATQFEQFKERRIHEATLFYFYETSVKWYPQYPSVASFEKFMQYVATLPDEWQASACFTRVGEDADDIEEWATGPDEYMFSDYVHTFTQTELVVDL